MNNIYKVIWSKAKNCYVVASEIARSHTKSASGSEKIGGVARHALLALGAACAIACGGFVNVGAADTVDVTTGGSTATVYTKEGTEFYVAGEIRYLTESGDVFTNRDNIAKNKADINALQSELGNKADATALDGKANKADVYSKTDADTTFATKTELNAKADTTAVTALDGRVSGVEGKVTTLEGTVGDASNGLVKDVATLKTTVGDASSGLVKDVNDLNTAIGTKANQSDLVAATNRITANEGNITELQRRTTNIDYDVANNTTSINGMKVGQQVDMGGKNLTDVGTINGIDIGDTQVDMNGKNLTGVGTINGIDLGTKQKGNYISQDGSIWGNMMQVDDQVKTNADAIAQEVTNRETAVTNAKTELEKKIQTNANNIKSNKDEIARVNGELVNTNDYFNKELGKTNDYFNSELSKTNNHFNTELGKTNAALQATNKRTAGIDRIDATGETTIEKNVKVDNKGNVTAEGQLTGKGVDAGTGDITTTGAVNAGSLKVENASHLKGDVTMDNKLSVTGDTSLKKTDVDGALSVTGKSDLKDNVILGTNAANTVTVNGTANFNAAVNMDKGLTVTNGETNLKKTTVDGDLKVTGTITTDKMVFGDKATNNYTEIDHGKVTSTNLEVRAGQAISSSSTFDVEKNEVGFGNGITGDQSYHKQTSNVITDTVKNNNTGDQSFHKQTSDVIMDNVKDGKNSNNRTQTKTETKDIITDENGNSSTTSQTASQNKTYLTDKDRKNTNSTIDTAKGYDKTIKGENGETSTKQDELNITNTAQNGTITNDAQNIVNNASGNITNKANTMDTTVTGKATESYGELETTVNGNETHTVTGNQTNKIDRDQENTIGGNQTTTVTGNVKEDYKKDLATTVGGNENHEVKGTKTETVEGKVTENFKNGQETNVTGDQVIKVSGTQTTTATDIKRNASGGMIDTIDNDYGTNTETKVAGKTTTDVSIKGTGEEGHYIRGANESRDYLIKGTLKNSETKTVDATSTEITDGKGKTSATIQDKTQISGSVTNGTSSAVSNVKADSIDTAVIEGTNTSLISQKKDSITSAVGNGTTSTVIQQGDKDITIASNGGTVGIVGKDIINNATNEITNTAGTKITDKVGNNTRVIDQTSITDTVGTASRKIEDGKITDIAGDSTITTENGKGTTFTKTGSTAYREGGPTDTNISGNTITTGKVTMDYADVMKDLGVHGNANITGKTTTGSLEVTGTSTLKGDVTMGSNATVTKDLSVGGTTTTKTLNVTENATVGGTLDVTQKATFHDDVDIKKNLSVVGDVTANSYKVGDKTYIDKNGIHANGQKITDVADGSISEGSKDAVNGGQLYNVKNDLEGKVNKVGANAAAMANLHPMEFDPDSKWNIAAAIGNYGSETAAALGAFYRPNDDVMVNLSTAFGTGENMVGGGVSVRLGKGGNKLSREESNALKDQVNDLTARMDALLSVLNPNMSKDFPDVPENHWAYEAVSRLAGNDIVQGYPDGEFHGERTMTRYEMAEIIYNALSRGAEAEKELVEEFKPELQAMAASEKATAERAEG